MEIVRISLSFRIMSSEDIQWMVLPISAILSMRCRLQCTMCWVADTGLSWEGSFSCPQNLMTFLSRHTLPGKHKKVPPPATLLIFQPWVQIFGWNFARLSNNQYTLYHQVWLKHVEKWHNYAVSAKTTRLSQCASVMQNWLIANGFIEKTEWPSSSPDLNPMYCHIWGTVLEKYHKLQPKHKTTDKLKVALQTIWEEMPWKHVNKVVAIFSKCLTAYVAVAANGGHSTHLQ